MSDDERGLAMYVIYDHPRDYPNEYVCRRCVVDDRGVTHDRYLTARAPTLRGVRTMLPPGLAHLTRDLTDDACIVEVWF